MGDHWLVHDDVAGQGDHDVAGHGDDGNQLQAAFEYQWAMLLQGPMCLFRKLYSFRYSVRPFWVLKYSVRPFWVRGLGSWMRMASNGLDGLEWPRTASMKLDSMRLEWLHVKGEGEREGRGSLPHSPHLPFPPPPLTLIRERGAYGMGIDA